ncbi:MAG: VCBS repeat-containing protein [Pyrinomonadaceae bacterium]|nr:VCBS repeat-containing protein [Pyrinomonadaceae bacterium]
MRVLSFSNHHRTAKRALSLLAIFALLTMMSFSTRSTTVASATQDEASPDTVFTNPAAILCADRTSNAAGTNPGLPPAGVYPSNIVVSGLSGTVTKITVTAALTSTFPDDLDILLVGPTGARSLVLSDAGGAADIVNVTYTFDQAAAAAFPDAALAAAGTYRPSNYLGLAAPEPGGNDNFPTPGPGVQAYTTGFNIFNGTNPNGTWSLYVVDDQTGDINNSLPSGWSIDITTAGGYRGVYDFTGDGRTDFTTLTLNAGNGTPITWKVLRNPANPAPGAAFIRTFDFGVNGTDAVTAGDYVGDGKTDASVWRSGFFYHAPFPEGTGAVGPVTTVNWGQAADILGRVGDYDGDGKDDETVLRIVSSIVQWHIRGSAGTNRFVEFGRTTAGISTFVFQGADFTGDGREELVVCEVVNSSGLARWLIGDSITGAVVLAADYGNFNTDFIINPDDYNGDGKADIVVWRFGGDRGWYIRDTQSGGTLPVVVFGIGGFSGNDIPLRGNYDGDGKADIAVFRPSTREWFWIRSLDGAVGSQQWGLANEVPLPNLFTF